MTKKTQTYEVSYWGQDGPSEKYFMEGPKMPKRKWDDLLHGLLEAESYFLERVVSRLEKRGFSKVRHKSVYEVIQDSAIVPGFCDL